MTGSGKTQLTKLFTLDALREVRDNPYSKLIVYEPKREFYAWLLSFNLPFPVRYFMPSDRRSVALNITRDYPNDTDSATFARSFYPENPNEHQKFWGDSLRTIYAGVMDAIKAKLGYVTLRLVCLVVENEDYTEQLLQTDPYLVQARKLVKDHGDAVGETKQNIQMTIHSRIAEMKVMAAHLDAAARENGLFSLRDFIEEPNQGVLAISKDSTYGIIQDPMNGVLLWRLIQLLDAEQYDERRKIFIVLDEFPTLAGDKPSPHIDELFLRLRSRGVVIFIAYQSHATLLQLYGQHAANFVGQCSNLIYLSQADVESARYAATDLGTDVKLAGSWNFGGGKSSYTSSNQKHEDFFFPTTELLDLPLANRIDGVHGRVRVKTRRAGEIRWAFQYQPAEIDAIPRRDPNIPEYLKRDPKLRDDYREYFEEACRTHRPEPLTPEEKLDLGLVDRPKTSKSAKKSRPSNAETQSYQSSFRITQERDL